MVMPTFITIEDPYCPGFLEHELTETSSFGNEAVYCPRCHRRLWMVARIWVCYRKTYLIVEEPW
jgi:hypothetical protein